MKSRIPIFAAIVVLVALATVFLLSRNGHQPPSTLTTSTAQSAVVPVSEPAAPAPVVVSITAESPVLDTNARLPKPPAKKSSASAMRADAKIPNSASVKPPIRDPAARAALASVGVDSEAEDYWIQAINDPTLPAEERKDLIEDLNEDGLKDPHHPRPEDMPIIASRIALIEELAPDAADEVNAKAFAEAYKDLVNLWKGLPAD